MDKDLKKKLAAACPVCEAPLAISRLSCTCCDTAINTSLPLPPFLRLPAELQQFVLIFLRCRGNIREVEGELGISYPTVCKRLDMVNGLLENRPDTAAQPPVEASLILARLERGEITARQAAQLLKGRA